MVPDSSASCLRIFFPLHVPATACPLQTDASVPFHNATPFLPGNADGDIAHPRVTGRRVQAGGTVTSQKGALWCPSHCRAAPWDINCPNKHGGCNGVLRFPFPPPLASFQKQFCAWAPLQRDPAWQLGGLVGPFLHISPLEC